MAAFLRRVANLAKQGETLEENQPTGPVEPLSPERLSEIRCHHWKQIACRVLVLLRFAFLQRSVSACLRMEPEEFEHGASSTKPQGPLLSASKSSRVMRCDPNTCDHPVTFEGMRTRIGGAGGGKRWQTCLKCGSRWELLDVEEVPAAPSKVKAVPRAGPKATATPKSA